MSSSISIGAANQLCDALENAGFSSDDVTKLRQFGNLSAIKSLLYGKAEISYSEHLIDCDVAPFIPDGWTVEEHKLGGQYKFSQDNISLYLSAKQNKGSIEGNKLRKELADKPVLNANVLDYLLAHPEVIPEEWKGKYLFFWGTIYRNSRGDLCVRYLYWYGSQWYWLYRWLDDDFDSDNPAVLAS